MDAKGGMWMAGARSTFVRFADVAWRDAEPGVRVKPLWSDGATGRALVVERIQQGTTRRRRHVGGELALVLEGATTDERGTATPGTLCYRPPGCVHTETSAHGATILALVTGGVEPAGETSSGPRAELFALHDIPWEDPMTILRVKRIWEHPAGEPRVALMRFAPGSTFPRHRHDGDEIVYVVEGAILDEDGVVAAGDVAYRPAGCVHDVATENGATVLGIATGRVVFL